jgi:hypothetical protein
LLKSLAITVHSELDGFLNQFFTPISFFSLDTSQNPSVGVRRDPAEESGNTGGISRIAAEPQAKAGLRSYLTSSTRTQNVTEET